jgi:hypothetical protein
VDPVRGLTKRARGATIDLVSVTHPRKWAVTGIEVALDLEVSHLCDSSRLVISGPAEPRICLVAAFALNSQLDRIVAAVDRTVPARPPLGLWIAPSTTRSANASDGAIAVRPMRVLLQLQSKLIRAIEPGLVQDDAVAVLFDARPRRDEAGANFVRNFLPDKVRPTFEPSHVTPEIEPAEVKAVGLTIYRLGERGRPEAMLAHWTHANDRRSSALRIAPRR